MSIEKLYKDIEQKLSKHHQLHLLSYYEQLDESQKASLLEQLKQFDFEELEHNFVHINENEKQSENEEKNLFEPMDVIRLPQIQQRHETFSKAGMKELSEGNVAVVLLAGGQGTRLGFDGPKGAVNIGIDKPLYLFEIIVKKLSETVKRAGRYVDLYIMVSNNNEKQTIDFFEEHHYFGYAKEHIIFFRQTMVPKMLADGKLVLDEKDKLAMAPSGNGVWYESLKLHHLDEKMERDHIRWINLLSVDNPLYNIVDETFLGAIIESGGDMGVQVVEKADPYEKVGVICRRNGRPYVKEYYEMTKQEQERLDENDELFYRYGVILNYMFQREALEKQGTVCLPVHFANKKVPYLNQDGIKVMPEKENGYIMEKLALDMIGLFQNVVAYEVDREKNFAPIKNRTGKDSLESARRLLIKNLYDI